MAWFRRKRLTRRELLAATLGLATPLVLAACGDDATSTDDGLATEPGTDAAATATSPAATASPQALAPTPSCTDADDPTPEQTEGPYFTPDSPERSTLREAGMAGTPLTVSGLVLSTECQPIAGALLDFWQANDAGEYDNAGYTLRGHQFTDTAGRYSLETIKPGLYTGRTRHIHVKVQAPNQPILTTQLYFPGEPENANDGIYDPVLEMAIQEGGGGLLGTFNFVLQL
jgi:protocatechuate 3,4-dioxygenase beta subunit